MKLGKIYEEEMTISKASITILKLFIALGILDLVFVALRVYIDHSAQIELPRSNDSLSEYPEYVSFLIAILFAPVVEELTFRLGLKFTKANFIIMCAGIIYITIKVLFNTESYIALLISVLVNILFFFIIQAKAKSRLEKFWKTNEVTIFYLLLGLFSLFHLANYELNKQMGVLSFILVLPHFFAGIILSYARLKLGIVPAILLHTLGNAAIFLPSLLIK